MTSTISAESFKCNHCGKELKPAETKPGIHSGYWPCACNRRIMTDEGVALPGSELHDYLIQSGNYKINDVL